GGGALIADSRRRRCGLGSLAALHRGIQGVEGLLRRIEFRDRCDVGRVISGGAVGLQRGNGIGLVLQGVRSGLPVATQVVEFLPIAGLLRKKAAQCATRGSCRNRQGGG
ncbi:MAG: hypothetical protein ACK46Q_13030, partial [Hyphomonas sp.]